MKQQREQGNFPVGQRQAKSRVEGSQSNEPAPDGPLLQQYPPRLNAGHLALDFVNTRYPDDFLRSASDLVRWSQGVGVATEVHTPNLLAEVGEYPEESRAVFTQLITLREASYGVMVALIHQTPTLSTDLAVVQNELQQTRIHEHLVPTERQLAWQSEQTERGLTDLQWKLCRAVELVITSELMRRVKECPPAQGGCGWLFLDRSKNGSRVWCSDDACGSRMRMRHWYARKRDCSAPVRGLNSTVTS